MKLGLRARVLSGLFAILGMSGPSAFAQEAAKVLRTVKGVAITSETFKAAGNDIEENESGEYRHGFIMGRPMTSTKDGLWDWSQTYEFKVNQGAFKDTNTYIGSAVSLSSEKKAIFDAFAKLNREEVYVFEYIGKNPWNPEIESSRNQLTKIYTIEEFIAAKQMKEIPFKIVSGDDFSGSQALGSKQGRIVDVERYGMMGDFCAFELNIGGLAGATGEALVAITVLDNEVCNYAERLMALGIDVVVDFTSDFFEVWQPSDKFCKGITCVTEVVEGSDVSGADAPLSEAQIEAIKVKLLNDSTFISRVLEQAKKKGLKN